MAFRSQNHIRCKLAIDNEVTEDIHTFNYLGFSVSYCRKDDVNLQLSRF